LKDAKFLLGQNSQQHALCLYLYTAEEFGKSHLLKEYSISHAIPSWIFGRKAVEPLPDDAKLLEDI
jgi:hypothetical protein